MHAKLLTFHRCLFSFGIVSLLSISTANAQSASPTPSPTPGEDFQACLPVADCVTNGLPAVIDSCYAATPACVSTNHDKTVVSAEQIANRAIAARQCDTKTFTTKGRCQLCFRTAQLPLRARYDAVLFHGLLGYATRIVENAMHTKCDSLPTR